MTQNGILFDIDGTLWDASESITASWNQVLARQADTGGLQITTKRMQTMLGKTSADIFRILLPGLSEERRAQISKLCCDNEKGYLKEHSGTLYPLEAETLIKLTREFQLFVVSNCQVSYMETFLEHCGLRSIFSDTECYGRTRKSKGENIRLLLGRHNLQKAVYIGDTQLDYDSSQYAGIPFVHAAYGFGSVKEQVPAVQAFCELPAAVSKIF